MKDDRMAYPTVYNLNQTKSELTKLELISAMCLQGMISNSDYTRIHHRDMICQLAIDTATMLLKRLEAKNDNS